MTKLHDGNGLQRAQTRVAVEARGNGNSSLMRVAAIKMSLASTAANNAKRNLCNGDNFLCIFVTFCGVSIYKSYAPLSTGRAQAAAVGGVACSSSSLSLRGAGSADSCKMPNLSHTLPNCQHSLAVCLFICFAHGLHDLINTPAKLQRPLTPHFPLSPTLSLLSLVGVPCNSSVAARKLFPFAAHTRNMLTLKHT